MRALVVSGVVVAALAAPGTGPAAAQTESATHPAATASTLTGGSPASVSAASYEQTVARLVNSVRARHSLQPVAVNACADGFAEKWAGYLARNREFYHQSLRPIMNRCNFSRVGEILALGNVTPRRMIRMWLHSPPHRRLMLDPRFRLMGVAAKQRADGSWLGCIDFGRH